MLKAKIQRKLTEARKTTLLGRYPDGEAVGHALIQRLIVDEQKIRKNPKYRPPLTLDALAFLRDSLKTEKDKETFSSYERIHGAICQITENLNPCTQTYYHGLFRALMLLQLADGSLDVVYKIAPYVMDREKGQEAVSQFVKSGHIYFQSIKDGLLADWEELIVKSLNALFYNTCLLQTLAEVKDFKFKAILPPIRQYVDEVDGLQQLSRNVYNKLKIFVFGRTSRNRIEVHPEVMQILESINQYDLETLKWQVNRQEISWLVSSATGLEIKSVFPIVDKIVRKGF